jgi:predicted ATPase
MRVSRLKIDNFKNLRDFEINFDADAQTTVLVGRNGSGKSNLLEALIMIFRDLDLGVSPNFKYAIEYSCNNHKVFVDASSDRVKSTFIEVDGKEIPLKKFSRSLKREFLPKNIFGYYSGPSNRMEQHFEKHQEKFYQDLLKGVNKPLRPLLYARLVHSQFALLAFFSEQDKEILGFLNEHLWIDSLDSVLFVMRQPPWTSKQGDERFWRARGTVQDFLNRLYRASLSPLRRKQRVQVGFRSSSTLEHLYLFIKDPTTLRALANSYSNQQEFFKALESTYISKLMSEVRIRVKIRNSDGSLTFRELSEGEQQLLMVLGLLRFTKEDESLFLLDEPDTHLNPAWSLQYLDFLGKVVGEQSTSHIIMTTHDPLTIAGLERKQVQLIQRDIHTGKIAANYPEQDPRGMGISALLTSDVYGLKSQLDTHTMQALDRKRELDVKEKLTKAEKRELEMLTEQLHGLDFSKTARDPLYEPFVRAMTQALEEEKSDTPVLTPDQQERQRGLALEIIKKLREPDETH